MQRALIAALLLLSGCNAQPPAKTADEIGAFSKLAEKTVSLMQMSSPGVPASDVRAGIRDLLDALRATEPQIDRATRRIAKLRRPFFAGEIDPIELSSCIEASIASAALAEPGNSPDFGDLLAPQYMSIHNCISKATTYVLYSSNKQAADDIGFAIAALNALSAAILANIGLNEAFTAGFNLAELENYHSSNEVIIAKLAPRCNEWKIDKPGQIIELHYDCAAYDGHRVRGKEIYKQGKLVSQPIDRMLISAEATQFTSRGFTMAVQPKVKTLMRALEG